MTTTNWSLDHEHWVERRMGLMDGTTAPHPEEERPSDAALAPLALRLLPDTAVVGLDGRLSIGGVDVVNLAETIGTPLFIYDETHLRSRCQEARRAFGDGVAYASKAFLCQAMAGLVHEEGLMIDVASGGELYVALAAGVPAERLVLHGSNKSTGDLRLAFEAGVGRIVVDSFDEISRIEQLAQRHRPWGRPHVLIRVNPGVVAGTHQSLLTGQEDSKFGFSVASGAASEAVARLTRGRSPVELVGFHVHVGSQILDLSTIDRTVQSLAKLVSTTGLAELCVGGGLGVTYTGDKAPSPSLSAWAARIHEACRSAGIPDWVRITAEPGRAIAASAAITCYTVGTIKQVILQPTRQVRTYVSVDGGMSDNPRPALYGSRYEAFLPGKVTAARPLSATVTGQHCESGDILVKSGHLPEGIAVGDVLATPVTGAYGYAMASNYNKIPRPPVVFVRDGKHRVVTRRETYEDLIRLDT